MTTVHYSRLQLIWHGLMLCIGPPSLRTFDTLVGGPSAVATGVYAFGLPIGGIRFLWMALGDTTALRADADGLFVRCNWQSRTIPWARFAGAGIEDFDAYTLAVTKDRLRCLTLSEHTPGGRTQNTRLIRSLLKLTEADLDAAVDQLRRAALRGVTLPAAHPLADGSTARQPAWSDGGFDPDAIVARDVANKNVAPSPPAYARQGFGRKGG